MHLEKSFMSDFEIYMRDWILKDLSYPVALLNNLPKCPYAKQALLERKILFFSDVTNINIQLENCICVWDDNYTDVALFDLGLISVEKLESLAVNFNKKYKEFLVLDDHTEVDEKIDNVNFSNGRYNILLCQKRNKVVTARKILLKKGYYMNWPKEYYDSVVSM